VQRRGALCDVVQTTGMNPAAWNRRFAGARASMEGHKETGDKIRS
jgi:hypothetical protein